MNTGQDFVDYYAQLQVSPDCDASMLEKAYRHFAKMYHPDHPATADVTRFQEVVEAYDALKDPARRAKYDLLHASHTDTPSTPFRNGEEPTVSQEAASHDAEVHDTILAYLYKQRREHADEPGVNGFEVQQATGCSEESFEFHLWYLKNKGFVEMSEQGMLTITVDGVDHVISMSQADEAESLLITKAKPE